MKVRSTWVYVASLTLLVACRTPEKESVNEPSNTEWPSKAGEEWITIPGGTFQMGVNSGGSDERPVHSVSVPTFQMTKTEVTVAQYKACSDAGKCEKPKDRSDSEYCNWGYSDRGEHPINCVDWNQANQFCSWVGGRLPSEAEWEYAARSGGKNRAYPWGNTKASCSYAVMMGNGNFGCGKDQTWPVCSKTQGNTSHELCDLSGNVWEWVADWYHYNYEGAPTNGDAWTTGGKMIRRVLRGGSLLLSPPTVLRAASRIGGNPTHRGNDIGFRCSRDGN